MSFLRHRFVVVFLSKHTTCKFLLSAGQTLGRLFLDEVIKAVVCRKKIAKLQV
jgi:hypothetical protein